MANVFDYIFNLHGNFTQNITGMTDATGNFSGALTGATEKVQKVVAVLGSFDYAKNLAQSLAEGFNQLSTAGIKLDSQMHDLSAVAGVTGDGLKQIETFARQSAKAFGTDAALICTLRLIKLRRRRNGHNSIARLYGWSDGETETGRSLSRHCSAIAERQADDGEDKR